jgi:type IV pilus assembly protein PilM
MSLFASKPRFLGIDIGSSSIKIVELSKDADGAKLMTYGFTDKLNLNIDSAEDLKSVSDLLVKLCVDSEVSSKTAIAALPTFSVFSSILNLSNIAKKDISSAVHWEAKKVIPLPLDEMILDWKIISEDSKTGNIKTLLTGAPKNLVKKYIEIFKQAQINLVSLETETFSLVRALIGNDKSNITIIDMGDVTTDITIVSFGIPMLNRSIDIGGKNITEELDKILGVGFEKAEQFKFDLGINSLNSGDSSIPRVIVDTVAPVVNEIKYAHNLFQSKDDKKVEKIILSGGSAMIPGFSEYLSKVFDLKVIVGDPWARINYPQELKPLLAEIGSHMAVSVGLALRNII